MHESRRAARHPAPAAAACTRPAPARGNRPPRLPEVRKARAFRSRERAARLYEGIGTPAPTDQLLVWCSAPRGNRAPPTPHFLQVREAEARGAAAAASERLVGDALRGRLAAREAELAGGRAALEGLFDAAGRIGPVLPPSNSRPLALSLSFSLSPPPQPPPAPLSLAVTRHISVRLGACGVISFRE